MIIIELTMDDQYGDDGPKKGAKGFLLKKLGPSPEDEDELWYTAFFGGFEGVYNLHNKMFEVLDLDA